MPCACGLEDGEKLTIEMIKGDFVVEKEANVSV